jgi:hypothetical protein
MAPKMFLSGFNALNNQYSNRLPLAGNSSSSRVGLSTTGKWRFYTPPTERRPMEGQNGETFYVDLPGGVVGTIFYQGMSDTDDDYYWGTTTDGYNWSIGGTSIFDGNHNGGDNDPVPFGLYTFLNKIYIITRTPSSGTIGAYTSTSLATLPINSISFTGLPAGRTWRNAAAISGINSSGIPSEELAVVHNGTVAGMMSRSPSKELYYSLNGNTWTAIALPSSTPECLRYIDNKFVVTTTNGRCYYSTDMQNWTLAFNLNDDTLVDKSFYYIDGYWVFLRTSQLFDNGIAMSTAGGYYAQAYEKNVAYITNSLSNPTISHSKTLTITRNIVNESSGGTLSLQSDENYFHLAEGHIGFVMMRYGSQNFWGNAVAVTNSTIISWLLGNDQTMPEFDNYESAAMGYGLSNSNQLMRTKSGKFFRGGNVSGADISATSYTIAYRDFTMPDSHEAFVLPLIDSRYFTSGHFHDWSIDSGVNNPIHKENPSGENQYNNAAFLVYENMQVYTRIN